MTTQAQRSDLNRRLWLPPLVSVAVLFILFLAAMLIRRTAIADQARPVMIGLSATAGLAIAAFGVTLVARSRTRGAGSAIAGGIMIFLGGYTIIHVL